MNHAATTRRRLHIGAEVLPNDQGVEFRVWAPRRERVEVIIENGDTTVPVTGHPAYPLHPEENGYFVGHVEIAGDGTLYRYRLDGSEKLYPDPASRFQPDGPHGPSQVVDPHIFAWTDTEWKGVAIEGQVIYEMHIGTFTREGTWEAAIRELPALRDLGITIVEPMPVADFPGRFGWGYDGVNMFAPTRLYGVPDDFRRFVDTAHRLGMGVLLDVVYNHFGPDGNYLREFSLDYFTDHYKTEWGDAINFDGEHSDEVRAFFIANAGYWVDEFHIDGLRLDATHSIRDASSEHIMAAVGKSVRAAAGGRATIIVAESESQEAILATPLERGGCGLDGVWNDDFHHAALVALTGHNEAYYSDFRGTPQELISAIKWGYLYQGQHYVWQRKRRGSPAFGLKPAAFVTYIENHDQIANSSKGLRPHMLTSPGEYRAMTALMLLAPGTPLLFQGQEFASTSPFLYFADHNPELAKLVRKGRAEFLMQFASIDTASMRERLDDPESSATFERCKLDFRERELHKETYALHRDLLALRRKERAFRAQRLRAVDGAVLGERAFVLRFFDNDPYHDRLLLVNLGIDLNLPSAPEPLLAPPEGLAWNILFSTEDLRYGGSGTPEIELPGLWRIPGRAAVVLYPTRRPEIIEKERHG